MSSKYTQNVPVIFGEGAIRELGDKVKELGCSNVMCVYDSGVKAAGVNQRAEDSLKAAGIDYLVFDKITTEPFASLVNECGAMAKEAGVDCFVAIGGGSSMDLTKAASILVDYPGPIEQYFKAPPLFLKSSPKIILVPTTSGTGSEVTQVGIISLDGMKPAIFTDTTLAILDPELTYTCPPSVTMNTGFDAFTHASEALTSNGSNPRSDVLAMAAISKIRKYVAKAVADGTDKEARREMALASNFAGIAFADTSCHIGHNLADGLSTEFHSPHGWNCIVVNAEVIRKCAPLVPEKVKRVGEAMGLTFDGTETPEQIGDMVAEEIYVMMREAGFKGPQEYGMDRDRFISSTRHMLDINPVLRDACPYEQTKEVCDELYAKSWDAWA